MIPQAQQIDRIAEALGVSSFAITGFENNISLKTEGDFMGLMIMFIKSNILCIKGERDENSLYDIETVSFEINPEAPPIKPLLIKRNSSWEISW